MAAAVVGAKEPAMIDPPTPPADDADGVEPTEESGAGYGNHAPDAEESSDPRPPSSRT